MDWTSLAASALDTASSAASFGKGVASGVGEGAVSMAEGLWSLGKGAVNAGSRLATDSAYRQAAAEQTRALANSAVEYGGKLIDDPATRAQAYEQVQTLAGSLKQEFLDARAQAERDGKLSEFYGRVAGRGGFEVAAFVVPAAKLASIGKVGEAAELAKAAKASEALNAAKAGQAATKCEAVAVAAESAVAGSIRHVNAVGGKVNCVNCTIATDATLAGAPASALGGGPFRISVLERTFGARFGAPQSIADIADSMSTAGSGARGIVFGSRPDLGHVFNVVNQNGIIRFLDGQTGGAASLDGFQSFQLLRTN